MNNYIKGQLYTGNIKINNKTLEENIIIFYDSKKDVFYKIDVLNHLLDLELNNKIDPVTKSNIEKIVKDNTFPHLIENSSNIPYIEEKSIKPFNNDKTKSK